MDMKLTNWEELQSGLFRNTCAEQPDGEEATMLHEANTTFYAKVPQEIRRCFFLDGNAVNVLLELVSWGMLDRGRKRGITEWYAINQQVMALHLGLSENTVCSKLKELQKKQFIEVQRRGRRNFYRLNTALNPYLVLSEAIHGFIRHVYTKSNYDVVLEQMEDLEKEVYRDKQDLFREAVVTAVLPTIKHKDFYESYAKRIQQDIRNAATNEMGMLSLVNYHSIILDLCTELSNKIERQAQLLDGTAS
ncbi:BlaI/MecI/CopY family transcriptional regulator [Paenibacillus pedocola]|uniref:BlaI/MecI/CopY family transcriptional regulator n=1 Tax=Paenibacillus pedocola TaxID=3242193 RepID=UPI0028779CA2|nr:BlaI/MecI/CopY family transcriptional regulator [Paenibacillus typhae]